VSQLKSKIPALAGGLLLAGCSDGSGEPSLVPQELDEAIVAFCMNAGQDFGEGRCLGRGGGPEECTAFYQSYVRALVLQFGIDADCQAAFTTYFACAAGYDCGDNGYIDEEACDDEGYALDELCGFE
jgi:hypothetical protein